MRIFSRSRWFPTLFLFCLPNVFIRAAIPTEPRNETVSSEADPYAWLEDINGPRALAWVADQNEATAQRLTNRPDYAGLYRDALAVLDSSSRIPEVEQHGRYVYNLWQDQDHPRGLYRRVTVMGLRHDEPSWETVLDVDALAKTEGKPWALGGTVWLPDNRHCLIRLSFGGGDAEEVREFDADKLAFVKGGFLVPKAKSHVSWIDANTLFVATDFGAGSLTDSGYPRVVKIWKRGATLDAARTLYEGPEKSVGVSARRLRTVAGDIDVVTDMLTFWTSQSYQLVNGKLRALQLPATANIVDGFAGRLVVWLKEEWKIDRRVFPAGSIVSIDPATLSEAAPDVRLVVASTANEAVTDVNVTPSAVLVTMLDNVRGRLYRYEPDGKKWVRRAVHFSDNGALRVTGTDEASGDAFVEYQSFTTPPALYQLPDRAVAPQWVKAQAPTFDGARYDVQQYWTTSADGTKVPYFVVAAKDMKYDGKNPVWLFSYGGFEVPLTPAYSGSYEPLRGAYGKLWLERGGVFVLANIRGGGEFGPAWHRAALKENHYKTFEDFEAIARDLVTRRITSPAHLGIEGRSNGGLLVASTMLRHPELYGAVVCGNPLIDMKRYHKLLAGASWMAEYGDPDKPDEWAYISQYSPYQYVEAGKKYPPVFFYTSTRDDRVHPGHARKMTAKMKAMGYDVDYFENTEGGHHGSVTNEQLATRLARTYAFLWEHLR